MKKLIPILFTTIIFLSACNNGDHKIQLINNQAGLPANFNFNRLGLKVMAAFLNKKAASISILYANPIALNNAIKATGLQVPGGVFALITWKKQVDAHWFGANIPGALQCVELIKINKEKKGLSIAYQKFSGRHLVAVSDTLGQNARVNYIINKQPSVMP